MIESEPSKEDPEVTVIESESSKGVSEVAVTGMHDDRNSSSDSPRSQVQAIMIKVDLAPTFPLFPFNSFFKCLPRQHRRLRRQFVLQH
jgi:hypothetical protein